MILIKFEVFLKKKKKVIQVYLIKRTKFKDITLDDVP